MLTNSFTAPGTIREKNQDYIQIDSDLRLVLIVDGKGTNGLEAAKLMSELVSSDIRANSHVYTAEEANDRLIRSICESGKTISETMPNSIAGFASLWLHRGIAALAWSGKCRIETAATLTANVSQEHSNIFHATLESKPNMTFLLASEGLNFAFSNNFLNNLVKELLTNFSQETLRMFWSQSRDVYDGDDRSLVLISLDPSDLKAGIPKEVELFSEIDRQFTIPLWLPASIFSALGVAGLLVLRKIFLLYKRFKHN